MGIKNTRQVIGGYFSDRMYLIFGHEKSPKERSFGDFMILKIYFSFTPMTSK